MDQLERLPNWARWLLTPLVSALAFPVIAIIANLGSKLYIFINGEIGLSSRFFDYILNPGLSAFAAVYLAAYVAPSHKRLTAIVFASLWVLIYGGLAFISVFNGEYKSLVAALSMAAGAGIAVAQTR